MWDKNAIRKSILDNIIKSFNDKYEITKEELAAKLQTMYDTSYRFIDSIKQKNVKTVTKYDDYHYKLGLQANTKDDIEDSPKRELLNTIKNDSKHKIYTLVALITKMQRNMSNQVLEDSDPKQWRYCKITKQHLLPTFMQDLASDGSEMETLL